MKLELKTMTWNNISFYWIVFSIYQVIRYKRMIHLICVSKNADQEETPNI